MKRPTLSNVSSQYGAPMGRRNLLPGNPGAPVKLQLVRLRFVDGDYDAGGAYWGNSGGTAIYQAASEGCEVFVRATDRRDAKAKVRATLPAARFFR